MGKTSNTESSPSPFRGEDGDYYKVIKLKTGESILCSMAKNVTSISSEIHLTMVLPVQAILAKQMTKEDNVVGEMFVLRPWIGLSSSQEFVISTDIVLTIGDLRPAVKNQYLDYLRETQKAERILQKEEQENEINNAIYRLLSEVNPGKKIQILRDDD